MARALQASTELVLGQMGSETAKFQLTWALQQVAATRYHTAGEEPEEVPMAALDWVVAAAVVCCQVVIGQVWFEMEMSGHATVRQYSVTTS